MTIYKTCWNLFDEDLITLPAFQHTRSVMCSPSADLRSRIDVVRSNVKADLDLERRKLKDDESWGGRTLTNCKVIRRVSCLRVLVDIPGLASKVSTDGLSLAVTISGAFVSRANTLERHRILIVSEWIIDDTEVGHLINHNKLYYIRYFPTIDIRFEHAGCKLRPLALLDDGRDFIFEPNTLETLSTYAHLVDEKLSRVFVRKDSDFPIKLSKKTKLGRVVDNDFEVTNCYMVAPENDQLAVKVLKRRPNWFRNNIKRVIAGAAVFGAAISPTDTDLGSEIIHPTGVTNHGNSEAISAIGNVIEQFSSLWKDTGNVSIPENEYMDIPLVDNWRDIYKLGQAKVYPVG